jgi:hypothetical protein
MFVGARVGECSTTPKKQGRGPNGFPKRAIFAGLLAPGYLLSWTWRGLNDIQVTRLFLLFTARLALPKPVMHTSSIIREGCSRNRASRWD